MEEKKGELEEKKDSLMWSEEDYDAMQKLTGFDDESVLEEQKKGVNIVMFCIVCIISLIVGILIGYNINKKDPEPEITSTPVLVENDIKILSIYNRLNASGELYLYVLDSQNEEISILDLTDSKYAYQYIDESLYVLIEKDGLNLYEYTFNKDGYHRNLVKKYEDSYDAFYFNKNVILVKNGSDVKLYDKDFNVIKNGIVDANNILAYTSDYVVYSSNNLLNIYYFNSNSTKTITKKLNSFIYLDNDEVFYTEQNKLYKYSIIGDISKSLTDINSNSIFTKFQNYYLFNDGKSLYIYSNDEIVKLKDFEYNINELAYLNSNSVIIVLEDYNSTDCLMNEKSFNLFNIKDKSLTIKTMRGCLNTQVINGIINLK